MTRSVGHLPINSSSELRHRPTTASPDSGLQGAQLVQVPQLSRGCTSEYSPCGVCALRGTHRHAAPGRAVWGWQETAFCWITHMPSGEIADCFSTPFLLMFYMETPYLAKGRKEESCTGTRARSVGQDRFFKAPIPTLPKKVTSSIWFMFCSQHWLDLPLGFCTVQLLLQLLQSQGYIW